jgi:hypothetical protein
MAPDTFLDRPREAFRTSAGELQLPILYRGGTAVLAYFQVDPARAAEVLAGMPLVPARFGRGTALAAVAAFDLDDTSIGPYRQLATAVAVLPRDVAAPRLPLLHFLRARAHADVGLHVLDLPVTSARPDAGGREIWGFPRLLTAIDVETAPRISVVVQAPEGEEPILVLEGRAGPWLALRAMDLVLYTVRDGALLRTVLESRGWMQTGLGRAITLRIGDAEHAMAHRLLSLGLGGARPFALQVCRSFRGVLNSPAPFAAGIAHAA